jgi:hypothetical protein
MHNILSTTGVSYSTRCIYYPRLVYSYFIFEDNFFVLKRFFHRILSLCMVRILERFVIAGIAGTVFYNRDVIMGEI